MNAHITINGVPLTSGQVLTMHVALQSFASDVAEEIEKEKASDDQSDTIFNAYLGRITEINKLLVGTL